MTAVEGIRKLGFKRWYERRLLESHMYLITCFLCMILVAVCLEELSFKEGGLRTLVMLASVIGGVVLGLFSWRRFKSMFQHTLRLAEESTCRECGVYARFNVMASGVGTDYGVAGDEPDSEWARVKCRKCGHEWRLG